MWEEEEKTRGTHIDRCAVVEWRKLVFGKFLQFFSALLFSSKSHKYLLINHHLVSAGTRYGNVFGPL